VIGHFCFKKNKKILSNSSSLFDQQHFPHAAERPDRDPTGEQSVTGEAPSPLEKKKP
jgi:hypothetical protein